MSRASVAATSSAVALRHADAGTTPLASEQWTNSAAWAGLKFASRGRHACPQASATSTNDGSTGAATTTSPGRSARAPAEPPGMRVNVGCDPSSASSRARYFRAWVAP